MLPFSMALMSGLKRQSVGARTAFMLGSSSFRDIAKLVKLYICGRKRGMILYDMRKCILQTHSYNTCYLFVNAKDLFGFHDLNETWQMKLLFPGTKCPKVGFVIFLSVLFLL